jgi:hypothetical protein
MSIDETNQENHSDHVPRESFLSTTQIVTNSNSKRVPLTTRNGYKNKVRFKKYQFISSKSSPTKLSVWFDIKNRRKENNGNQ